VPQNKWLYHIKKAPSPTCACGAAEETGSHLVFECPRFEANRAEFMGDKSTWEELDKADWEREMTHGTPRQSRNFSGISTGP